MSLLPNRRTLRSRWTTLLWAGSICSFAVSVAHRMHDAHIGEVDAATAAHGNAAMASALAAEED